MNVDEAMAYAKQLSGGSLNFQHHSNLRTLAIGALYNEVERLRAELAQLRKDWCDDDEAIKQQALRVLPAEWVEGDSVHVPRGPELAERMADKFLDLARECLNTDADCERLLAELAAAKAASVCPVEITRLYGTDWGLSLKVECRSEDDCETLWKWLRNQKCERGEG